MARIRTIKPDFWRHEDLSALPEATHLLAAALLNYADDEGYFNANPRLIQAECCPLREPSVSIQDSLAHLSSVGYLRLGSGDDGKRYGQIVKFKEHQRINRPTGSKINSLTISWEPSHNTHQHVNEPSSPERKGTGKGKEDSDPNGSAAISSSKLIYDLGKGLLARADKPPKNPGGVITRWLGDHGEDAVLEALRACERKGTPEPVAFITGILKKRKERGEAPDTCFGVALREVT